MSEEKTNPHDPISTLNPSMMYERSVDSGLGLTKREYFAAMAMQGLLSNQKEYTAMQIMEFSVRAADNLIDALNE